MWNVTFWVSIVLAFQTRYSGLYKSEEIFKYRQNYPPPSRIITKVANVLDCDFVESKFDLQSRYYVPFRTHMLGKGYNLCILAGMD